MKNFFSHIRFTHSPATLARKSAFTLLETMIAMALLGLILAGSFSLLIASYATMRRTEESLYVTRVLETAVEMTRNLSFADIAGDPAAGIAGYASTSPLPFSTDSTLLTGANGEILYSKGPVENTDPKAALKLTDSSGQIVFDKLNDDLYRVTANVTYTPFRSRAATRTVTTYVARKGINRR